MTRTALIVEDTPMATTPLEVALAGIDGMETMVVTNGQKAIDYLEGDFGNNVCAVLTDLNMPIISQFCASSGGWKTVSYGGRWPASARR